MEELFEVGENVILNGIGHHGVSIEAVVASVTPKETNGHRWYICYSEEHKETYLLSSKFITKK